MNQANSTGPVDKVAQVQAEIDFIEGLADLPEIDHNVLRKAARDARSHLDALSAQLQQQRLT